MTVKEVPTKPIDGQKTGTSGLRKKTKVFMSDNYLANWVQSLFNALGDEASGKTLALGGDGRYVSCSITNQLNPPTRSTCCQNALDVDIESSGALLFASR